MEQAGRKLGDISHAVEAIGERLSGLTIRPTEQPDVKVAKLLMAELRTVVVMVKDLKSEREAVRHLKESCLEREDELRTALDQSKVDVPIVGFRPFR